MIPTIQLVYGTMPKIKKQGSFAWLEYDSKFYIFEKATNISEHLAINSFLRETFNCPKENIAKYLGTNIITLYNIDPSSVINKLITDDFYDSFQVLLTNLKTQ